MGIIDLIQDPVFFDIFGLAVFSFLLMVGIWSLKKKMPLSKWVSIIILVIGILGLIVDGYFVFTRFLLR